MPLKTLVKAGSITNLSDARYCAGMGVEMLGFGAVPGLENHIPAKLYQEIRGWVSGPKVVAEIYGIKDHAQISGVIEGYMPDLFELTFREYANLPQLPVPAIIRIADDELESMHMVTRPVAFWLISERAALSFKVTNPTIPILVEVGSPDAVDQLLKKEFIKGIAIRGSEEIRPGFKTYDVMADILESLAE